VTEPGQADFTIRAPTRIDFGGGWTDVPPYDVEQGGFVCNVAISRYASVRVRPGADSSIEAELSVARSDDLGLLKAAARKYGARGARIALTSDFPIAAGLGGSSAAGVATVAALMRLSGLEPSRAEIAEASRELEIVELGIAGGRQDHYAAAFGGALGIRFGDSVSPEPIALSPETLAELPKRCIVMYTGKSRISANTITAVLDAYRSRAPRVLNALRRMRELAEQMAPALGRGDFDELGHLVGEQWSHQRSLHPAIPTPLIDTMIAHATNAGAIGCKALGASGGGCVLFIAPADGADDVRRAVAPMGMALDYSVDTTGVMTCS
jgi:D-glycero-alpha-D-manno-heptose-7-phosphate kinase